MVIAGNAFMLLAIIAVRIVKYGLSEWKRR
jgi:hypothetical protein